MQVVDAILTPRMVRLVAWGIHQQAHTLCRNVRQAIEDVVEAEEEDETAGAEDIPKQGVQVLQDFFASNETFRGKVKANLMRLHLSVVSFVP